MKRQHDMFNAFNADHAQGVPPQDLALISRREAALGPAYRLFYERPIHLVSGQGVWLQDAQGQRYLDAYNNVASMGHCHPRVVAAVSAQMATLATHTRYLHEAPIAYAERILATMNQDVAAGSDQGLGHFMFTCTGSEANDLALRIAQAVTGGEGIIVTANAYHGVTRAVSAFSPSLGANAALDPWVRTIPAPDSYRAKPGQDVGAQMADDVRAACASLRAAGYKPAMLIVDTIFSTDGVFDGPKGMLAPAVAAIRAEGGIFIADEVQPGFCRTGERWWGFQRHGLAPDIVTVGKPMGNGYPVAGLAVRADLMAEFGRRTRYFNTFGGNPVAVAAASAVLDIIEDEGILAHVDRIGHDFREALRDAPHRGHFGDVRGAGLFIGVECIDPETGAPDPAMAAHIVTGLRDHHVLISNAGAAGNVLKIRPPLVFAEDDIAFFMAALAKVLDI